MKQIAILIPTWNNSQYLEPCLKSILNTNVANLFHIYVINNGHKNSCDYIEQPHKDITVIQAGKNLGWEGGLKLGVEKTKEPYIMFLNDDTYVPQASVWWLHQLLTDLNNPGVGAVGPSTNVVMGSQNIFIPMVNPIIEVNMLIGFCVLFSRKVLKEIGGVDDTLPGGDDLDFSIRLRKAGYKMLVERRVFVYHHGFKTGERIKGTPDKGNGWNSYEMKERTDTAIIHKHGFREWFDVLFTPFKPYDGRSFADLEGNVIRSKVKKKRGKIVEVGVGNTKTLPNVIGVDLYLKGEKISSMADMDSQATVRADVQKEMPFEDNSLDCVIGRHILEHMIDPIKALKLWTSKLKKGGQLILALPDQDLNQATLMNIEHVVAFTKDSAHSLFRVLNIQIDEIIDTGNLISFVIVGTKNV